MKRFAWTLILLIAWAQVVSAQQLMSPVIGQRILRIIDRAEGNTEQILEDLANLASGRNVNENDRGFIIREQAALLVREERTDEARELLQATLRDKTADYVPPLRLLYAQLLLMAGESAQAVIELEQWSAHVENPYPLELSMLAYANLQEERWGEATTVFERVIELSDADNDQWFELLAYAYTRNGESQKALRLLDTMIIEKPWETRWWRQLSNVFLLLENYDSGTAGLVIADYTEQLNYSESKRMAGLLSMLDMPALGAQTLQQTMERFPEEENFEDQMLLGELWMLARENELAIQTFQQAWTLDQDNGEPALKIAQLHLQWERYGQAREALLLAQSAYGEETPEQIFYLLAIVEINLGNLDAASTVLGRLEPDGEFGERATDLQRFIENLRNAP